MKSTHSRSRILGTYSFFTFFLIPAILISALSSGCDSDKSSSSNDEPYSEETGFYQVGDFTKIVELGTSEKSAKADEKPSMKVKLDYDFLIGKHEVTCAEFRELIDADFVKDCKGDDYPITDVTFYDAVLFANAKTKSEMGNYNDRVDSAAYTYTAAEYDTKGHCIYLENFNFRPEAIAYRLPTEAEWMFVADKFFNAKNSWNADNSDYELHEVCTAATQEVCDMAGNAMEWVNDWFVRFKADSLLNFAGGASSNGLGQRVLKGGSYRSAPEAMHAYSRGDVYTVTSSTMADYVGFRLAFGPIASPTWLDKDGNEIFEIPADTISVDTLEKDSASFLNVDSAGAYYKSGGSENASMLRYKLELLWQYRNQSKLVILGSSRSMYGIKPLLMDSSLTAINMSQIPNSLFVSDFLLKNYVVNHVKNLKYLVLSVDFDMWWRDENDSYDNFFLSEYKIYPGYVYDENHNFWKDGYPEGLLEKTHEAPGLDVFKESFMPSRGFMAEPGNSWGENPTVDYDSTWVEKNPELYAANLNKLKEMIALANEHKIKVIGIIFPQHPGYVSTGSYSRYGPRRSQADSLIQEIADISKDYSNFILWDEHKAGYHDYADSLASSKDHLNEKGAQVLTSRLDSLIKTLK